MYLNLFCICADAHPRVSIYEDALGDSGVISKPGDTGQGIGSVIVSAVVADDRHILDGIEQGLIEK